jgi:hypothetical protein
MWKIRLTFIDSDLLYKSVLSQVWLHMNICIVKMILMCKLNISKSEINYYWFIEEGLLILWSLKCDQRLVDGDNVSQWSDTVVSMS